jgi:hypothetical protein
MIGVCDIKAFDAAYRAHSDDDLQETIETQTGEGFGIIHIERSDTAAMPFVPTGSDGDGPVFALMSDGNIVGIELPFMEEVETEPGCFLDQAMQTDISERHPLDKIHIYNKTVYGREADKLIQKIRDLGCTSELYEWWEREIGWAGDRDLALRKARERYDELLKRARANGWETR